MWTYRSIYSSQGVPLVVTTGDVDTNRQLFQKYEIRCPVLLQEDMKVASQYHAHGTPMGYLIDEQGDIASDLTAGAPALLALATASDERKGPQTPKVRGNKSLDDSRLNRSGLKAGTPAPGFRLPRLDGGELTLEEYRGRPVLLIFSDPQCGPCDQLAPHLEAVAPRKARPPSNHGKPRRCRDQPAEGGNAGDNVPCGAPEKVGDLITLRHVCHARWLPD